MIDMLTEALEAQRTLAEYRQSVAENPRENSIARASRAATLSRLQKERDRAAEAAGKTAVELDAMLYGVP